MQLQGTVILYQIGHALMHLRLSISTILIDFVRLYVYFDHRSGGEMIGDGQRLTK